MKYEVVLHWSKCDKEFHYELYINDLYICYFCSFEIVKLYLRKVFYKFQRV